MPVKLSLIFQVTTAPTNLVAAIPHTGSWSEGFWRPNNTNIQPAVIQQLMSLRRILLPIQAAIVGYRQTIYTIAGPKLIPGGSSATRDGGSGNPAHVTDLPQVSLEMVGQGQGVINSNRFSLKCIPDIMMTFGEYQPTPPFSAALTNFRNYLRQTPFGFIGRRLNVATENVLSIAAGTVTLSGPIGGVAGQDYIRFNRVKDGIGNPVQGRYLITAIAGNSYTVVGLAGVTMLLPSGSARIDELGYFAYQDVTYNRATVRKIGRPFELYRGRRSKKKVS